MYNDNVPGGHYRMANRVQVFDPPRAISWEPGMDTGDGNPQIVGHIWRYDLAPAGPSGTETTLSYDWSAVPDSLRQRLPFPFPPFAPDQIRATLWLTSPNWSPGNRPAGRPVPVSGLARPGGCIRGRPAAAGARRCPAPAGSQGRRRPGHPRLRRPGPRRRPGQASARLHRGRPARHVPRRRPRLRPAPRPEPQAYPSSSTFTPAPRTNSTSSPSTPQPPGAIAHRVLLSTGCPCPSPVAAARASPDK